MASEFFHHFFAYDFGGEESRPSNLQAWIVEGGILVERGRDWKKFSITKEKFHLSRQGKNLEARTGNWALF